MCSFKPMNFTPTAASWKCLHITNLKHKLLLKPYIEDETHLLHDTFFKILLIISKFSYYAQTTEPSKFTGNKIVSLLKKNHWKYLRNWKHTFLFLSYRQGNCCPLWSLHLSATGPNWSWGVVCVCVCICICHLGRDSGLIIENIGSLFDIFQDTKHCIVRVELDVLYANHTKVYTMEHWKFYWNKNDVMIKIICSYKGFDFISKMFLACNRDFDKEYTLSLIRHLLYTS